VCLGAVQYIKNISDMDDSFRRVPGVNERVAALLKRNAVPFVKEHSIGGIRPDLPIETPDHRSIIIEAKRRRDET
jgi:hypothetical protein